MDVIKANYKKAKSDASDSFDSYFERAMVKAVVSGGSIVVILPKSGKKLVI